MWGQLLGQIALLENIKLRKVRFYYLGTQVIIIQIKIKTVLIHICLFPISCTLIHKNITLKMITFYVDFTIT
jgi:hypothetical protein